MKNEFEKVKGELECGQWSFLMTTIGSWFNDVQMVTDWKRIDDVLLNNGFKSREEFRKKYYEVFSSDP
jgi:hypothetical protein